MVTHDRFHQKEGNGAWETVTETSVAVSLVQKMMTWDYYKIFLVRAYIWQRALKDIVRSSGEQRNVLFVKPRVFKH